MSDRIKSILFALVLCLVCSLLLTAAATTLQSFQSKNIQTDWKKNILRSVVLIDSSRTYEAADIDRLYTENIFKYAVDQTGTMIDEADASGKVLPIYLAMDKNEMIRSYIIPIKSRGLWGEMYG